MAGTVQYLICATPRCGSGLLADALRSTGVAGAPQEWFARDVVHRQLGEWNLRHEASTWQRPLMRPGGDYCARVRAAATTGDVLAVTLHWNQWELFGGTDILPDLSALLPWSVPMKAVLIRRRNLVDQAVSALVAQSTHVFYQRAGDSPETPPGMAHLPRRELEYDYEWILDQVIRLIEHEAAWREYLAGKRVAICNIEYESLITDISGTCATVLCFLGQPAGNPPQPRLVKQAGDINQRFSERFRQEFGRSPAARVFPASMLERFGLAEHV